MAAPLVATPAQGRHADRHLGDLAFRGAAEDPADGAFLIALPVVLYQVWAFVAPGLYSHEKKLVLPLVISSTLLFFIGVAFCYFFVFGQVFQVHPELRAQEHHAAPDIEEYLSFVLGMFLAFGLAFEVPIAVVVLVRMGIVTVAQLRIPRLLLGAGRHRHRLVTPPDVGSHAHAAGRAVGGLYEVGIWAALLFIKHTKAPETDGDAEAAKP
jgi:sec-independent protein translocase protein TatC